MSRPKSWLVLAVLLLTSVAGSSCAKIRPPSPAMIEVVWDGERFETVSEPPLAGEAVVTVTNRSDQPIDARLLAVPADVTLTDGLDMIADRGVAEFVAVGEEVLGPRRREPGRVAPRLVEEQMRLHVHLTTGTYIILLADGQDLIPDAWLGVFVSPR